MNVLFDFISLQDYHNGGEEYTRKILNHILRLNNIKVFGLYDSKLKFLDNDLPSSNHLLLSIPPTNINLLVDS